MRLHNWCPLGQKVIKCSNLRSLSEARHSSRPASPEKVPGCLCLQTSPSLSVKSQLPAGFPHHSITQDFFFLFLHSQGIAVISICWSDLFSSGVKHQSVEMNFNSVLKTTQNLVVLIKYNLFV